MDFPTDAPTTWLLVAYIIVRDMLIPLANKIIPAKVQQHADLEARETAALEQIGKSITQSAERLTVIESGQGAIIKSLENHSTALAVLVDRVTRIGERGTKPRTRKGD